MTASKQLQKKDLRGVEAFSLERLRQEVGPLMLPEVCGSIEKGN